MQNYKSKFKNISSFNILMLLALIIICAAPFVFILLNLSDQLIIWGPSLAGLIALLGLKKKEEIFHRRIKMGAFNKIVENTENFRLLLNNNSPGSNFTEELNNLLKVIFASKVKLPSDAYEKLNEMCVCFRVIVADLPSGSFAPSRDMRGNIRKADQLFFEF